MTNIQTLEKRVIQVIARVFKKDASLLSRETQLIKDLLAKSMNFLELQALLEAEFSVELPTQGIMKAKTAGDIIDLVTAS